MTATTTAEATSRCRGSGRQPLLFAQIIPASPSPARISAA